MVSTTSVQVTHEAQAVPFEAVAAARERMEYASCARVMFTMLALTGCRIRALDNMKRSRLYEGGVLMFHEGKRTTGLRRVVLPSWFVDELTEHRRSHDIVQDQLFCFKSDWLQKSFLRQIRPLMGPAWNEMVIHVYGSYERLEYKLQLKGLRKSYQTHQFALQVAKWGSADIALEFTSKEMKHSSTRITAYHYLRNFDEINAEQSRKSSVADLLRRVDQSTILEHL